MAGGFDTFVFTDHALFQMKRRGLSRAVVEQVVRSPQQGWHPGTGRQVLQSLITLVPSEPAFLVRVIVDVSPNEVEVVTAYRTSKTDKYWRSEQ